MTIEKLLEAVKIYNPDEVEKVYKAYKFAELNHEGQMRQSGEPYITHPLNVTYILADMHADADTLCAGLLHDVLEDTCVTKEELKNEFNEDIANLVDGVSNLSNMDFSSKEELKLANTRKIITGITNDVRIIIIKLADRLHNMRTLQFKSEYKQKEKALETMEIFVPMAYYIGAYKLKSELEDISLQYLKPYEYNKIAERKMKIEEDSKLCLNEMLSTIKGILDNKNIPNEIKVRTKNIYGIYKKMHEGDKLSDIHDLHALKVMVDDISNCYQTLGIIHSNYPPINNKFKDYICNPKTNMYSSLHTTVFANDNRLVQTQIRTFDMDKIASYGLTAYWDINKGEARNEMQKDLKNKYQFFKSLVEINNVFGDNQDFVKQIKNELFTNKIYIYTTNGDIIELPIGSTPIDFAYKIHTEIGNTMVACKVNGEYVPVDYILKNKDRVYIITDILASGPKKEWENCVKTTKAKKKIKEYNDKYNKH